MIFRMCKNKENPYVQINKTVLQDKNLSWKAKGIMAYCLSLPDNWQFHMSELVTHSTDGIDSLKAGIRELKKHGYLERKAEKVNGKIVSWITNVYEEPQERLINLCKPCGQRDVSTSGISTSGFSTSGKPATTNNKNKTEKNITKNNNVEGLQNVLFLKMLNKQIAKRLGLLVRHGTIQQEDVERLIPEVLTHINFRPEHLTETHSLNAAIALIRKGTWSTPKRMLQKNE